MPKNSSRPWTPEEDKKLLELRAAGKSREMIAAALHRSAKSIPSRLYALSKANRPEKGSEHQVE
jgi:DNA-binding NarL/FixJ family response regulator